MLHSLRKWWQGKIKNNFPQYDAYLPGPNVFKRYGIQNVIGNQDTNLIRQHSELRLEYDSGTANEAIAGTIFQANSRTVQ